MTTDSGSVAGSAPTNDMGGGSGVLSATQAKSAIAALRNDLGFGERIGKAEPEALAHWTRLHEAASAEPGAPIEAQPAGAAPSFSPEHMQGMTIQHGGGTADQHQQMLQWKVEEGRLTLEEANRMLAGNGIAPIAQPETNPEIIAHDQEFPRASSPTEYRIPPLAEHGKEYSEQDHKLNLQIRSWLHYSRFSAEAGSSLAERIGSVAKQTQAMDHVDYKVWKIGQERHLQGIYGPDYAKKMALGGQLLSELEKSSPGIVQFLEQSGAGNDALISSIIIHQAEILDRRAEIRERQKSK